MLQNFFYYNVICFQIPPTLFVPFAFKLYYKTVNPSRKSSNNLRVYVYEVESFGDEIVILIGIGYCDGRTNGLFSHRVYDAPTQCQLHTTNLIRRHWGIRALRLFNDQFSKKRIHLFCLYAKLAVVRPPMRLLTDVLSSRNIPFIALLSYIYTQSSSLSPLGVNVRIFFFSSYSILKLNANKSSLVQVHLNLFDIDPQFSQVHFRTSTHKLKHNFSTIFIRPHCYLAYGYGSTFLSPSA